MILAALGLTFLVTDSRILMKFRNKLSGLTKKHKWLKSVDEAVNCPQCFGVYAGFIVALIRYGMCWDVNYIFIPLGTSFIAFVLNKLIMFLNTK